MCFDYIAEWTLIRRSEKWWFMQQTKGEWPWGYTRVPGCCRCKLHTWREREREREKLGEFHNLIGIWWSDLITGLINTHFNSFSLKTKEVEIFYIFLEKELWQRLWFDLSGHLKGWCCVWCQWRLETMTWSTCNMCWLRLTAGSIKLQMWRYAPV